MMAINTVTICYNDGVSGSEVCQSSQEMNYPAAPSYVAHSIVHSASQVTSDTIDLPTERQAGDLCIIFASNNSATTAAFGTLSGFTRAGVYNAAEHSMCYYWKILTGSEATTQTIDSSPYFVFHDLIAIIFRGVNQTTPIQTTAINHDFQVNSLTITSGNLTPSTDFCLGFYYINCNKSITTGTTVTTPAGYTELSDRVPRDGYHTAMGYSNSALPTTSQGITSTRSPDLSSTENNTCYFFALDGQ